MFERIFVTTDGSGLGNMALPYAANLARHYAAPLMLAYVAPDPYSHLAMLGPYTASYTLEYEWGLEEGRQILDRSMLLLGEPEARTLLLDGRTQEVADCLIQAATDDGAELIVMSSHGHGGLVQVLLGSVAARVLHQATVPVMVVRPEKARPLPPTP
ncbi:universal stress protein [Deinococcus sp. UYEF24]